MCDDGSERLGPSIHEPDGNVLATTEGLLLGQPPTVVGRLEDQLRCLKLSSLSDSAPPKPGIPVSEPEADYDGAESADGHHPFPYLAEY